MISAAYCIPIGMALTRKNPIRTAEAKRNHNEPDFDLYKLAFDRLTEFVGTAVYVILDIFEGGDMDLMLSGYLRKVRPVALLT